MTTSKSDSLIDQNNPDDSANIDFSDYPQSRIILDATQHYSFQKSGIEICAPDGSVLHKFSKGSLFDQEHNSNLQLRNQLYLIEHLFLYVNELQLPEPAVRGIEDLVIQSRLLLDKHVR